METYKNNNEITAEDFKKENPPEKAGVVVEAIKKSNFFSEHAYAKNPENETGFPSGKELLDLSNLLKKSGDISLEKSIKKINELTNKLKDFVEERIESKNLKIFSNHGHLEYHDDEYWGHYITPTHDGFCVVVYEKKNITGDPMDIEGERGPERFVFVPTSQAHIISFAEQLLNTIETADDFFDQGHKLEQMEALIEMLPTLERISQESKNTRT